MSDLAREGNRERLWRFCLWACLLFAALCLALPLGLSRRIHVESEGPTRIRVGPDPHVRVVAGGRLHVLAGDGTLRASYRLADFGLMSVLSDLIPLPGGDFFAAQGEPPSVWRCNEQTGSCKQILRPDDYLGPNAAALFLAWEESSGRLAVADNFEHRLLLLDGDGKLLDISSRQTLSLSFPQKLQWLGPRELAVVDTSRTRIVGVSLDQDRFGPLAWSNSAALPGPEGRPYRATRWLARAPDGGWWTLNSLADFGGTRVVKIPAGGGTPQGFDLHAGEELTDLAWFDGRLLVSDLSGWRVRSLDEAGNPGPDFGDAAFRAALDAGAGRQAFWLHFRRAMQIGVVVALLAAIWVAWKLTRLQTANAPALPRPAPAAVPPAPQTIRLELANDYDYVLNSVRAERSRSWIRILPVLLSIYALYSGLGLLTTHTPLQVLTTASGISNLGSFLAIVLAALGVSAPFHALVRLRRRSRAIALPARWKVDETGLDLTVGEALAGHWAWEALLGVDRLPEGFLVSQAEHAMNWFPLQGFASDREVARFDAWACGKAPRYRSIRRLPLLEWSLSLLTAPLLPALAVAFAEIWKTGTPLSLSFPALWPVLLDWFPPLVLWNTLVGAPVFLLLGRWTAKWWAFLLAGLSLGAALYGFCLTSDWLPPHPALAGAYPFAGVLHWLWVCHGRPR